MSRLATCPRCGAFVQPGWPECKICGFGPDGGPDTREPRPKRKPVRPRFLELLGGLATLAVLVLIAWGAVAGIRTLWNNRDPVTARQEFVVVDDE
jgi:hypothetical protein